MGCYRTLPPAWPMPDTPQGMCLDKGYDYDTVRVLLTECGFTAYIRARERSQGTQAGGWLHSAAVGGGTEHVNRTPGITRQWRRVHEGAHQCR